MITRSAVSLRKGGNASLAACMILITICSAIRAYSHAFSTFASYDDEGLMMMPIKRFIEGHRLYDEIPSIYGPLNFFYQYSAHVLTGSAVSNDSVRFVSISFWIVSAILLFLLVYKATSSLLLAIAAQFLGFRILLLMGGNEVAHPQELCILLLLAFGLAACYASNRSCCPASLVSIRSRKQALPNGEGIEVFCEDDKDYPVHRKAFLS
jgi:hypothetical protein